MASNYSHYVFVYCDEHDQGAVSIFNCDEYIDISLTSRASCYYAGIFKNILTMCCSDNKPTCKSIWRICGYLELNLQTNELSGIEDIQTNFDREGGGWKFEYFQHELYTSQGLIEKNELPRAVSDFLSHLDSPIHHKIKQD